MGAESVEAHSLVGASNAICTSSKPWRPSSACMSALSDSSRSASIVLSGITWVSGVLMLLSDPSGDGPAPASPRLDGERECPFAFGLRVGVSSARSMSSSDWTHERDDQRDPAERQEGTLAPPAHGGDPARLAATVGNQAFGAMLGRVGDGILPNGTAHPDVEAMIARTRGTGRAARPGVARERRGDARRFARGRARAPRRHGGRARAVGLGARLHDRLRHLLRGAASTSPARAAATSCSRTSSPTSCSSATLRRPAR